MKTRLILPLLLFSVACAGGESEAMPEAEPVMAGLDAPECWRRDNPTPEQLAERPSPPAEVSARLGGDEMRVCYSQPQANGRVVMGELVPFGADWRTGANESTALHLTFPAEVAGVALEPGSYSLASVPGEGEWTIIVHGEHERWGVPVPTDGRVGEGSAIASEIGEMVEGFTIRIEEQDAMTAHLVMEWEHTQVRVPVTRMEG